jgi:EpsI family protein
MIGRRDLILGASCLAAAGVSYQLTPRRHLSLLGRRKMDAIIPATFGAWTSQGDADLIKPVAEGSLAARLYSQSLSRIYNHANGRDDIMVMVAYGENQSDLLQLHRPEACYPAVGFSLLLNAPATVPLRNGASLPGRRVTAERSDRRENIIYWTRLGEFLPTDGAAQGKARLRTAMEGYIADGVLIRCSKVGQDDATAFQNLGRFISELVLAVAPADRPALVGTALSRALAA